MRFANTHENTEDGVCNSLCEQLPIYDKRFDGSSWVYKRRLRKAEETARKVMAWWAENGDRAYSPWASSNDIAQIKAEVCRSIGGLITTLIIGWIIKLVVNALIDWLLSTRSDHFRSVMRQRRG